MFTTHEALHKQVQKYYKTGSATKLPEPSDLLLRIPTAAFGAKAGL